MKRGEAELFDTEVKSLEEKRVSTSSALSSTSKLDFVLSVSRLKGLVRPLRELYKALKGQGPYKALKGFIRPLRGPYKAFKSLVRPLRGPYKSLEGLIRPLSAL